jgi:hypothetical protein
VRVIVVVSAGKCDVRPKESSSESRLTSVGMSVREILYATGRRNNGLSTASVSHLTWKRRTYSTRCGRAESVWQQRSVVVGTAGIIVAAAAAAACQGQCHGLWEGEKADTGTGTDKGDGGSEREARGRTS